MKKHWITISEGLNLSTHAKSKLIKIKTICATAFI
jgi:hypothetical protein